MYTHTHEALTQKDYIRKNHSSRINTIFCSKRGDWKSWLKLSIPKARLWHPVPSLHPNRWGNNGHSDRLYFLGLDAFELWCWRRILRVPWTARRSNQSILKEINSEYPLEGLMLKLQYFGHLMQRVESYENP